MIRVIKVFCWIVVVVATLPLLAFSQTDTNQENSTEMEVSKWTKFVYYFNVGALPPKYQYSYTITIHEKGGGEMKYVMGYNENGVSTLNYAFLTDKEKFNKLKKEIKKSNVLNLEIGTRPVEEIPDGGHSESLVFYGYENNSDNIVIIKSIPMYPELKYEEILNNLYKEIQDYVPKDIWDEIEEIKAKQ